MASGSIESTQVAFIDDSGDSTNNFLLAALVFSAALEERVRDEVEDHFSKLSHVFGLDEDFEFHGYQLGSARGARDESKGIVLKPHERDFIFQHSLHLAGNLETARLYTVYWDWAPGKAKVGEDETSRRQQTYALLLDFIEEQGEQVAAAHVDGTNDQAATLAFTAHRGKHKYPVVIAEPALVSSSENRIIQLVDLVAYATYQCVEMRNEARKPKYGEWHRAALSPISLDGGSSYGARIFDGTRHPRHVPVPQTKKTKKRRRERLEAARWDHVP